VLKWEARGSVEVLERSQNTSHLSFVSESISGVSDRRISQRLNSVNQGKMWKFCDGKTTRLRKKFVLTSSWQEDFYWLRIPQSRECPKKSCAKKPEHLIRAMLQCNNDESLQSCRYIWLSKISSNRSEKRNRWCETPGYWVPYYIPLYTYILLSVYADTCRQNPSTILNQVGSYCADPELKQFVQCLSQVI